MQRIAGKVAIVTGAASGIGAVTAAVLAAEGARVVVADLDLAGAEKTVARVSESGGTALAAAFDLGDEESIKELVRATVAAYGGVDILFNNAAATHLGGTRDLPIAQADSDVWDETMRLNLRGTMHLTKYVAPHLAARGGGSIVNASSGAGLSGDLGHPAYGASKAAVARLTQYTATEFGKQGIRCNAIAPGLIVTARTEQTYAAGPMRDMMLRHHLTPRLGRPEDIANTVLFLVSDESSFITGQVISVDGGLLAHVPYWADVVDLLAARAKEENGNG
jgi:NAD(P)-dependent dehydrogenase (short-subunit alcohol dehydrogenase family)